MAIYRCDLCDKFCDDDWDPAQECPWDDCADLCTDCAAEVEEQEEK